MTTSSTSPSSSADGPRRPRAVVEARRGSARAVWTDRAGGVSGAPYDTCNLGDHVGDDARHVEENRARVARALDVPPPRRWQTLTQVHGPVVVRVHEATVPPPAADAAVTDRPGIPLVVLAADCAPIALFADGAVGVVHAGWPGLLAGVVEAAVAELRAIGRGPVHAVLGPCIHPARYEFGADHLAALVDRLGPSVAGRTDRGTPALDVPAAVRAALGRVGVASLDDAGICTAADPGLFSHRRDGVTGRQGLFAILEP